MTTETYDWDAIVNGLNQYLHLRSIPIGMKLFERRGHGGDPENPAAPVQPYHRPDRRPGAPARLDGRDYGGRSRRRAVRDGDRLQPADDEWLSGKRMAGVWFDARDERARTSTDGLRPFGRY